MRYVEVDARNAFLNPEDNFILELEKRARYENVKKYINTTFKKFLEQKYKAQVTKRTKDELRKYFSWIDKTNDTLYEVTVSPKDKDTFYHYIDFLNSEYSSGKPIKLSIQDLIKGVKAWDLKREKEHVKDVEDGIKIIYKHPDGFYWALVFGKDSLNREGKLMNHCVGSYYEEVKNNKCKIYSLRDRNNIPHVTIEYNIEHKQIVQIQGNSNSAPKEEYIEKINKFLKARINGKRILPFKDIENYYLNRIGLIYQDDEIHNLCTEKNFRIKGDFEIHDNVLKLAEGLTIDGRASFLYMNKSPLFLPKNLTVNGNLHLNGSKITSLPEGLKVEGTLWLGSTMVEELPQDLQANCIVLNHTLFKNLNTLNTDAILEYKNQEIIKKKNSFMISQIEVPLDKLNELPDNLDISELTIHPDTMGRENVPYKFPKGLTVRKLVIQDQYPLKILKVPKYVKIENLYSKSAISLPNGFVIPGNLYLTDSNTKKLPKNLKVGGNLGLKGCKIKVLPSGLKVGGVLDLSNTLIQEIPEDLKIGETSSTGSLILFGTKIKKLPRNVIDNIYSLILSFSSIEELPENLTIRGDLSLVSVKTLKELPKGLTVEGTLYLITSNIKHIPEDAKIGKVSGLEI